MEPTMEPSSIFRVYFLLFVEYSETYEFQIYSESQFFQWNLFHQTFILAFIHCCCYLGCWCKVQVEWMYRMNAIAMS